MKASGFFGFTASAAVPLLMSTMICSLMGMPFGKEIY
jgi:hypothetical protein